MAVHSENPKPSDESAVTYKETLARLLALEPGWNGYAAEPPTGESIGYAHSLLDHLRNSDIPVSHVGPSSMGGVGISVHLNDKEFSIELRNSGKVIVTEISADGNLHVHDVTGDAHRNETVERILEGAE